MKHLRGKWTQFAADAEVDTFGTSRLCRAHNDAIDESAAQAARIAELESALRELVDDIGEQLAPSEIAYLQRANCPECEEQPEEVVLLCPLHKAQAVLAKGAP